MNETEQDEEKATLEDLENRIYEAVLILLVFFVVYWLYAVYGPIR